MQIAALSYRLFGHGALRFLFRFFFYIGCTTFIVEGGNIHAIHPALMKENQSINIDKLSDGCLFFCKSIVTKGQNRKTMLNATLQSNSVLVFFKEIHL